MKRLLAVICMMLLFVPLAHAGGIWGGGGSSTTIATDTLWDAAGDLVQGSGANTGAKLSAGATAGMYLRSGGAGAANVWSTLILPNAGTAFKLAAYTSANNLTELVAVGATGELLVGNTGAIPTWLTAGTSGYLLKAAGAGVVPAWSNTFTAQLDDAAAQIKHADSTALIYLDAQSVTADKTATIRPVCTDNCVLTTPSLAAAAEIMVKGASVIYDVDAIPVSWFIDSGTAPAAIATLTATNSVKYRDFSGAATNSVQFEWQAPYGIDATVAPVFSVEGWITSATAPATTETIIFDLACNSMAGNALLSTPVYATPVQVSTTMNPVYAQYDRWVTSWSTAVTITDFVGGNLQVCTLRRDTTDTYAQLIGVGWIKIKFAKKPQGS